MGENESNFFEENYGEIVNDIRELVEAESPSYDRDLLLSCAGHIESMVKRHTDSEPERIDAGGNGPILMFRIPFRNEGKPVLLLAHYDTVHSAGVIGDFPFSVDSGRLRGPGVFDMKTGLVQGIWALKYLMQEGLMKRPVILMATPDEEIGSLASRYVIEETAAGCQYAVVLEPSAEGRLKTSRKGTGMFNIKVHGRAAHAGQEPEKGVHAISEMARIVLELQKLNDNDKGTTVNVGTIKGGTTSNVVPAEAEIDIDIRVWTEDEAQRISSFLKGLKPVNSEARMEVDGLFDRPPMQSSRDTLTMVQKIKEKASEMGRKLEDTAVGGASDGNLIAPLGIPVLDGFGAVGGNAHSITEYVDASEITFRTSLLAETLQML